MSFNFRFGFQLKCFLNLELSGICKVISVGLTLSLSNTFVNDLSDFEINVSKASPTLQVSSPPIL